MQGEDYITYFHQKIFALETNYGAAIAINQQLHHDCEKAKSDILKKEEDNERDEEIIQLQFSLYDEMKEHEGAAEERALQKTECGRSLGEEGISARGGTERGARLSEEEGKRSALDGAGEGEQPVTESSAGQQATMGGTLEEQLSKQLAEKEERHQLELSETAEKFRRELADQEERFRLDRSAREGILLQHISEKEESLQRVISDSNQLAELCASLVKRTHQLEVGEKKMEDLHKMTENVCQSMEVNKKELQQIKEESNQLLTALQKSKQRCEALEEELSKQLAEKEERHQPDVDLKKELAEQAGRVQQDLSERKITIKQTSEKEESLQEENMQPQELLTEKKKKKKGFWRRIFHWKKKTAAPLPPP